MNASNPSDPQKDSPKQVYTSPELIVLGDVEELTQGTGRSQVGELSSSTDIVAHPGTHK